MLPHHHIDFYVFNKFKNTNINKEHTYKLPEDDLNKNETCWSVFQCFNVNILD